ARGAAFLADPVESAWEIRAFFRDPDGHLFEITERKPATDRPGYMETVVRGRHGPEVQPRVTRSPSARGHAGPAARFGAAPHVHCGATTGPAGQPDTRHTGYCRASPDDEHRSSR